MRSPQVLGTQTDVILQQFLLAGAFPQSLQHEFDRNSSPLEHRLSQHYCGVRFDQVVPWGDCGHGDIIAGIRIFAPAGGMRYSYAP